MILLAIDTSTAVGNLSLCSSSNDKTLTILSEKSWDKQGSHSDVVTVMLAEALKEAQLKLSDIECLAAGTGPGSFTGLRVGVNLIRSLSYSLEIPIAESDSLKVLAFAALKKANKAICLLRAFRNFVYCATYEKDENSSVPKIITPPQALTFEELDSLVEDSVLCTGNAYNFIHPQLSENLKAKLFIDANLPSTPQALDLSQLVVENYSQEDMISWKQLKPLYIRGSEAEEKLKSGLLKPISNF